MKRALPLVLVLAAALAIGYVIGSQSDAPVIPDGPAPNDRPEPPAADPFPPPVIEDRSAEIAKLDAEIYRLKAELARRPAATTPDAPAAPTSPIRTAEATEDPDLGAVRVLVTDGQGKPLANRKVSVVRYADGKQAQKEDVVTDANGTAEVGKLEGGTHHVSVNIGTGVRSMMVQTTPGWVTEVRFELVVGVIVTGVVRDHVKGPLAKVIISLIGTMNKVRAILSGTTNEEGRYRIVNVPPGAYRITASGGAIGYSRRPQASLMVRPPSPVTHDFVVGLPGLSGVVRDKLNGRPIPGVSVRVQGGVFRTETTDAAGKFMFLDLPGGSHHLVVSKAGYGLIFMRGVKDDEPVTIELSPAATLRLTVTRPGGEPYIGKVYLGISPEGEGAGTRVGTGITTDENGRSAYDKIVPGKYRLHLKADGVGEAWVSVTVPSGETSVDVSLK